LSPKQCEQVCGLGPEEQHFLSYAVGQLKLSARGYHRLLKVARTIADMQASETVQLAHLEQALSFKQSLQMPK
jgi:magnesium chelatase family protein